MVIFARVRAVRVHGAGRSVRELEPAAVGGADRADVSAGRRIGLLLRGMSVDILGQIGFVVLVGLASKNAILIVEFAKQAQDAGATAGEAAVQAARTACGRS